MLGKQVIDLEKVTTGSLNSKPDPPVPMVECHSITSWMMFVSARLLKDTVYPKSKLAQQMYRGTGFLTSSFNYDSHGCENCM